MSGLTGNAINRVISGMKTFEGLNAAGDVGSKIEQTETMDKIVAEK